MPNTLGSFRAIDQENALPIINDYVIVPNNINKRININDALTAAPGSTLRFQDDQIFLILPEFVSNDIYPVDWYQILRDASVET